MIDNCNIFFAFWIALVSALTLLSKRLPCVMSQHKPKYITNSPMEHLPIVYLLICQLWFNMSMLIHMWFKSKPSFIVIADPRHVK